MGPNYVTEQKWLSMFGYPPCYNWRTLNRLALIVLLAGMGARGVSAQLSYFVDEHGRRVYVNPEPVVETSVPASPSHGNAAGKFAPKKRLILSPAKIAAPYIASRAAPAAAPAEAKKLDTVVEETARRHDVDANLVKAIIGTESNNNPRAVSNKGAMGLMQLMPFTARDLGVTNILDPVQNVDGGVRYLKYLLNLFGGDLPLSLAAYNAGPGAVERHGGIPPYRETREYVKKIGDRYGSLRSQAQVHEDHQAGILRTVDESGRVLYTNLP